MVSGQNYSSFNFSSMSEVVLSISLLVWIVSEEAGGVMSGAESPIPARYFRNEIVHRSLRGSAPEASTLGCGFEVKLKGSGQHVDSVFSKYSGILVLRGEGTYIDWDGRKWPTYPGCYFQRLPGRLHSTLHPKAADWAECYVNISQDLCSALAGLNCLDINRPVLEPGLSVALVERFDGLLKDLRIAPPDDLPRMLVLVLALIVDIHAMDRRRRRADPYADILDSAARELATGASRQLDLPALAARHGIGYEVFRKAFQARYGVAPGNYSIRRRMERARSLLTRGDQTVKEVAFAVGYPNEFAFSRQFTRIYGAPPSRFRGIP
jgi:AraC-like DNA-binding protein